MGKRRWFQIHLSTMAILALMSGGLLTINFLPLSQFGYCAPTANGNHVAEGVASLYEPHATVRFWVVNDIGWPIAIGRRSYYVDALNNSTAGEVLSKPAATNSEVDLGYAGGAEFTAGLIFNGFVAVFLLGLVAVICESVIRNRRASIALIEDPAQDGSPLGASV